MGGIGSGVGGGGKRAGAGRRHGARNRRTLARIAQHEESGKQSPLDFLIAAYHDEALPMRDRISAAMGAAPYHHARLSPLRVAPPVTEMDDSALLALIAAIEQRLGRPSVADRSHALADRVESFIADAAELPPRRQLDLLTQLATAAQARLHELAQPQPGDVLPRPRQPVIEHEPSAQPQGPVWSDGAAKPTASRSAEREIRYERDLRTGKLVEVG